MPQNYVVKLGLDATQYEQNLAKAADSVKKFQEQANVSAKGMDSLFKLDGLDSLMAQFDGVSNSVKKMGNVMSSSGSGIRQQMKAIQNAATQVLTEYRNLSEAEKQTAGGQQLYNYYTMLINKGAELRDNIGDVSGAINAMADDARVFKAMGQGVQVMASSFQVAAGAATLFGVSQEKIAAVQQKLTSIIAITNGLQQIQNLLQKESALMQTINIIKTQGWAAALGIKTAAQVADTAAIEANTVATEANSAAMKSNPWGLIISLLAAATVAVYELTDGFTNLTGEADSATQAAMAFNDEIGKQSDKLASNIVLINNMKNDMLAAGNNAEQQRKVFEKYRKKQVEVGLATKNAGEMHAAVVKSTPVIIEACKLRMRAAAAEAAMQVELGKVLSKVAEIRAKAMKGETVGSKELEAVGANIMRLIGKGLKPEQTNLFTSLFGSGFKYTIPKDKIDDIMEDITNQAIDYVMNGMGKDLQKVQDAANAQLKTLQLNNPQIKWDDGIEDDTNATDKNTNATGRNSKAKKDNQKASQGSAASAKDEKTALEQLDKEYNDLIRSISTLGKRTEENKDKFDELKKKIQATLMKKIAIMPMNTVGDVDNFIKTIQTLLEWLDKGSDEYKKFSELLQTTRINQANMKLSLIDTSTLEGAQAAQQIISGIVKILPEGSKELETWSKMFKDATSHAKKLQNAIEGIQEGSETDLKQQIAEIDKELQNENKSQMERQELLVRREDLVIKLEDIEKSGILPEVVVRAKIDTTFDYKKTDLEKIERAYEAQIQYVNDLYEAKKKMPSTYTGYDDQIEEATAEGQRLKALLREKTILEDLKAAQKEVKDGWIAAANGGIDGIDSIYSAWSGFSDRLKDEDANSFEQIMAGFKAIEQTVNTVLGFIETINTLRTALDSLKAVSAAASGITGTSEMISGEATATAQKAAATSALAAAQTAATTATTALVTAEGVQAATSLEIIAAIKAEVAAYQQLAAAKIMAAHAYIPFAGVPIASGYVAAMMGIIQTAGLLSFANGGIVDSPRLFGDRNLVAVQGKEMILNGLQQKKLFNLLDGGFTNLHGDGGEVKFKVRGRDLVGVLNNYNNKASKAI